MVVCVARPVFWWTISSRREYSWRKPIRAWEVSQVFFLNTNTNTERVLVTRSPLILFIWLFYSAWLFTITQAAHTCYWDLLVRYISQIKNKIKFSSYMRKFRRDRVKYLRIFSYIRIPHKWLCTWSHLNFLVYEENF